MKRRIRAGAVKIALLILAALALVVFIRAVFDIGDLRGLEIAAIFYLFGKLAGLVGFLGLSFLIFSGDTARFFDRFFGLDRIIKFQRKFSLLTMVFILSHPIFFILSSGSVLPFLLPDFSVLPLALGVISFYIFMIVMVTSKVYKMISPAVWQFIHILTYVLFFFSLYHAFYWGSDSADWALRVVYLVLLAAVVAGMIYRTGYKLKQRRARKFFVQDIKYETKDTFTLVLKSEKILRFKAGQFCFLRLKKNKLYARHPFTIVSPPGESELRFVVKLTGIFTRALLDLQKGEEVVVDGPFGLFTADDSDDREIIFIAGGVGIAPFMSMIRDRARSGGKKKVILLYGSKTAADVIYREELDGLGREWLKVVYVLSGEKSSLPAGECESGHIDKAILEKYVEDISNSRFYICGPESMKISLQKILAELEVDKRDILIEEFFW